MSQPSTVEWAGSLGISIASSPPPIDGYDQPCHWSARQIATRALILHGVAAVAYGVAPAPVVTWLQEQDIWNQVSPREQTFLLAPDQVGDDDIATLRWRQEAEWTLLWALQLIDTLGLPTQCCNTLLLVDELIPELGDNLGSFLASARTRKPAMLLAEDARHYDLWCRYWQTKRQGAQLLPHDLNVGVLYQRQYAFTWLHGITPWDDVECDA